MVENRVCVAYSINTDGTANGDGYQPYKQNLHSDGHFGLVSAIFHWVFEREVAVHRHGTHVPNGGCTHQNISGDPENAELWTQWKIPCKTECIL